MRSRIITTALCPSYCRPRMLAVAKQCYADQSHGGKSILYDLDDVAVSDRTWAEKRTSWKWSGPESGPPPSVPHKYNRMAKMRDSFADILCVWEDDDLYLADHLERIAKAWDAAGRPAKWWGHPSTVYSDYPGHVVTEPATGRFHAAIALTADAWRECPWIETPRADFDQQWMAALRSKFGPPCDYLAGGDPTYVFRWHTGHVHGQNTMDSPGDETWYERAREALRQRAAADTGPIVPGYDDGAKRILAEIARLG